MPLENYGAIQRAAAWAPASVPNAFQQGRQDAQQNALFDYKFQQQQQDDAASAAEEQAWDAAVKARDIETMLRIDPQATQLLQQHWQADRMSGLGDVGVYRKPMEVPQEANRPNIVQQGGYSYMFDPSKGVVPGSVQAPQRAPIEGPTGNQRDFQFYSSLTPEQQALYDKVNGRGAGSGGGVMVGPDGQLMVNPDPAKATEGERTSANYLSRMSRAEMLLGDYVPSFTDYAAARSVMSGGPTATTLANNILSPQGQQYYQAAADWVRAKLRKESGAVISPQEMEQEIKTYFPVPGDSPETIEQKRAARIQAQEGMKMMGGRAVLPSEPAQQPAGNKRVKFEDLP